MAEWVLGKLVHVQPGPQAGVFLPQSRESYTGKLPLTGSRSGNMLAAHLPAAVPMSLSYHSQRKANAEQTDSRSALAGRAPEGGHRQDMQGQGPSKDILG